MSSSARNKPRRVAKPQPPASPDIHARQIAEAVETAWHRSFGSGRLDVPLSVVATLACVPARTSAGEDTTEVITRWDETTLMTFTRQVWTDVIRIRPELTHLLYPMIAWIFEDDAGALSPHVHAVASAALRTGQLDLTGSERRLDTDLLGTALALFRPKSALQDRGQFYTPADIADLMARMTGVDAYSSVTDPTMGTGGMFRAAAKALRASGRDPATVEWIGCDIDEIAVACATVNSMSWGLGHQIVFRAGDTLDKNWEELARAQRDQLRDVAAGIERDRRLIALLRSL